MNVSNLIIRLQQLVEQSTNPNELMILGKSIEKIKVGNVDTVATFGDLPTLPLAEDGELFLVEADEELYYNAGSKWINFLPPIVDVMSWGGTGVGDGTNIFRSSPVTVVGGITNWSQVSAGGYHSLALTTDNTLYAWGRGGNGRLGDGTTIDRSSPVTVIGGITNWSQVSAGLSHSIGVTDTGIAYAWGASGGGGQLGDGTTVAKSSPVTVVGGITDWSTVSAGYYHSIGISNGIAYAWGFGGNGRLGDGTTIDRSSPVTVVGGITNWSSVSAGRGHSLGVTDAAAAYAWGSAYDGQLGNGTTIDRSSPVAVIGGITNWSSVSAGRGTSFGLTDTGIIYSWGSNNRTFEEGALGDGTTISRSSPVTVVGGITNWSQVSAGGRHSLALTADGILYAWGSNHDGRLGDGFAFSVTFGRNRSSPVTVVGGITTWSQISAGGGGNSAHSLAIKSQ